MSNPMFRLLPAVVSTTLGSACGSTPTPSGQPIHSDGSQDQATPAAAHAQSQGQARHHGHHGSNGQHGPHGHHGPAGSHHTFAGAEAWAARFDDPARDAWQRPAEVIESMELSPEMVVADVGAGTGYFAVRLARAVPKGGVVATDAEPDMVRYLSARAQREQLPNLRAVAATHTDSGLAPASVDRILIVHVWHHIAERITYAQALAPKLRPGGKLVIVEFSASAKHGPPPEMRVTPEAVIRELEEAGWTAKLAPLASTDQYIIEAEPRP